MFVSQSHMRGIRARATSLQRTLQPNSSVVAGAALVITGMLWGSIPLRGYTPQGEASLFEATPHSASSAR